MAPRNSQQDQSGIIWQTVGVRLGQGGLDLRDQTDGNTLVKLLNARFRDDKTVERRNGHTAIRLRDNGSYPIFRDALDNPVSSPITPVGWIYGHGQLISKTNALADENTHIPEPGVASGVFTFEDTEIAWTGDRLLVVREDGNPALGTSTYWDPTGTSTPLDYGIPAYLPVQTDSPVAQTVPGDYTETCLTSRFRVVVAPNGQQVDAWITDRVTGELISHSLLGSAGGGTAVDLRVFQSGAVVAATWRVSGASQLYAAFWQGQSWSVGLTGDPTVNAYDVAVVSGGFYILWRNGSTLKVGKYVGSISVNTPFSFGTTLTTTATPNGAVAIAVSRNSDLAVAFAATDGLYTKQYDPAAGVGTEGRIDTGTTWTGLSANYRILATRGTSKLPLVVHAGSATASTVAVFEQQQAIAPVVKSDRRYNSRLSSKSFVVGNEVFAWVRSTNSSTLYLIAGSQNIRVCGYADREVAAIRALSDDTISALSMVSQDPLDLYTFTWARPVVTGQTYAHPGNALIGDINFLPQLSAVQYGKSCYLAGSAVRNWDGVELGHAGFQDYAIVQNAVTQLDGGALTVGGTYRVVVYAVRYNKQGERFQSPAIVSVAQTLISTHQTIRWQIQTLPSTDHGDVVFEVYRTENGGTVFYLEGTVANRFDQAVVTFDSTLDDATLRTKQGDGHQNLVPGSVTLLQSFGPIGSSILRVVGDRMWTVGGQVPAGYAQYSLLKDPGYGAGFDATGPLEWVDTAGGDIVSIAELANAVVFFQLDRIQVLGQDGPDNFGSGSFSTPQLVLSDGAITHFGTASTQVGVVFWGANGPRILDAAFRVQNISLPVQQLTEAMFPIGVQVNLARQEVVWYTETGDGVLWNYLGGNSRWAQWSGLPIAGCSPDSLATVDGRVFYPEDSMGDDGAPFEFAGATGELRPQSVLDGATNVRGVGITGKHLGEHNVRLRVFYDGSPLWDDEWTWQPSAGTGLTSGTVLAALTAAQIDALGMADFSGGYSTHRRTSRQECRSFRIEWSDVSASGATFIPYEISLELGARAGFGRVTPGTFS